MSGERGWLCHGLLKAQVTRGLRKDQQKGVLAGWGGGQTSPQTREQGGAWRVKRWPFSPWEPHRTLISAGGSGQMTGGLEGDSHRLEPRLRRAEGLPGGSPSNRCGTWRRAGAGRWVDLAVASVEVPFGRLQQRRKQGHQLRERAGGGGVGREGRWERTRAGGGVPAPSARRRRRNAATRFPGLCRSTER